MTKADISHEIEEKLAEALKGMEDKKSLPGQVMFGLLSIVPNILQGIFDGIFGSAKYKSEKLLYDLKNEFLKDKPSDLALTAG